MKNLFLLGGLIASLLFVSCGSKSGKRTSRTTAETVHNIRIQFVDSVDGRPTYNVFFPDGRSLLKMYPEEIAQGLIDGLWHFDETLIIAKENALPPTAPKDERMKRYVPQPYEYQLMIEDDLIVISDYGRHVATVPLDSSGNVGKELIKDNE